jgi:hypothetical protein
MSSPLGGKAREGTTDWVNRRLDDIFKRINELVEDKKIII